MVYTARINEYVHNAATTQGPEVEGVEAGTEVKAKVVTTETKPAAKKSTARTK